MTALTFAIALLTFSHPTEVLTPDAGLVSEETVSSHVPLPWERPGEGEKRSSFISAGHRSNQTIWIESEAPDSANVKFGSGAPGRPELLSGGRWLTITGTVPDQGADLSYKFSSDNGPREIWHRAGFEGARSPFEWRIDDDNWNRVDPKTPTIDLEELAEWNGVAWMDMGSVSLAKGDHRLQIHIPKPAKGDVLYGSDAFALAKGTFHPRGRFKPGEDPLTPEDRLAAQHSFAAPEILGGKRQTIKLGGVWQIARDDEIAPALVATPMVPVDHDPVWRAISVPGDKAEMRPDMALAHRVWYRTRIVAPASAGERAFVLTFHQNSLNTTVLVNGHFCGFNKNPFVRWSCDVTKAMHPGVNEVLVGIKDAWYGFSQDPNNPAAIRENFAFPESRSRQGFLHLDYPVWADFKSGLLDTPELTVSGRTYASDVFVRPSLAQKRLGADITVKRDSSGSGNLNIELQVVDPNTGKVAKTWPTVPVAVKEGEERTVSLGGPWNDPVLWTPDHPKMYLLRTVVKSGEKVEDSSDTPFGFREWTVDGPHYLFNGVVWHGWAELVQGDTPQTWLANYRRTGQRFQRMAGAGQSGDVHFLGMPFDSALDWCDRNGVTIRRCGPLDGEAIGYMPIDDHGGIYKPLLQNVRDQIVAQVLGERNHPSINMWSVENEWLYINTLNLWAGLMDQFEADMAKTIAAVRAVDRTRLAMTDGGGSGKGNILPVQGDHYVYTNEPNDYPDLAYGMQPNGAGRGRWVYDGKRPRYAGEDYFATGINPADYAWIQGETAFGGKADAYRGMAMVQRMITEGYRWSGVFTAFHLWIGTEGDAFHDKYAANAERAVFVRQYDSAFSTGSKVVRTLGVFNDSLLPNPIALTWRVQVGGKQVQSDTRTLSIPPGTNRKFDIQFQLPKVAVRTAGVLSLELRDENRIVFSDSKPLSVLPDPQFQKTPILLYDPSGTVAEFLSAWKAPYRVLSSLKPIPAGGELVIGPDALTASDAADPSLAAFAAAGGRVIVLEQTNPLARVGLPTDLQVAKGGGAFGFADDPEHPVVAGIQNDDLRGWGAHSRLYETPYLKVARGVRSIVEVGPRLAQTALAEVPVGKGLIVLCQLQIGHNLAVGGPARNLLANMISYAAAYRRIELPVRSYTQDRSFEDALEAIGVSRSKATDPMAALAGDGIAVLSATPEALHTLVENLPAVKQFVDRGGYLVLNGLTPEGLADYDRIVGAEHMIRPFRREKTALATPRDGLSAGITAGDVVMYSGQKMFDYNDDRYVADDIFKYVVDVGDVAPFATLPNDYFYNAVNGFTSSDGWPYIFSFELKNGAPEYTMTFPKPLPFRELTWIGNGFYHKVKKIGLSFDGGPLATYDVQPNIDPQALPISPVRTAKSIRLAILDWTRDPNIGNVVGIDNIYLQIVRPPDWSQRVRPLLNIGGIVRYPQGKGAVVLVNLAFKEKEEVPENAVKKRSIFAAILRNLGATFGDASNAAASFTRYVPISLAGKATAYRNERGWFGDPKRTLADLPTGSQVFDGVPFDVYDFPTSPVPTAVVLGGPGVPGNLPEGVDGIKVGEKTSALFFLQSARIDTPRSEQERKEGNRLEIARYVVTYADGSITQVPIYEEIGVDDFRQSSPHDLPGARLAWSKRFASADGYATAYMMEWTNPRPDVPIASIGLEYGADRRGIPALLAITAAR